ncbi:MAG: hypothetical protein HUJ51_01985 [Eggerthellaceae bacterium]|nr:hypothetical protein [Eggerthellaceae bacterium]
MIVVKAKHIKQHRFRVEMMLGNVDNYVDTSQYFLGEIGAGDSCNFEDAKYFYAGV